MNRKKNDPSPYLAPAPTAAWPFYSQEEIDAVSAVLRTGKVNYWTGEEGRKFEQEYAAAAGCEFAIALSNGSAALELALEALEVPAGAEVITSSRTFIASASCAVIRNCIPILAEVDRDSGNITAETIARVITPETKAIIAVHLAGWPCEMDPIMDLANARGIKVIEDCAQANGATYKGRPVGSIGHAGAFSFCQDKIITTGGEGGMLTTHDEDIWERAWSYKDHGKSYDAVYKHAHAPGFRWLHETFGTNFRMTEMQSAIGRIQLRKLPEWNRVRGQYANLFREALSGLESIRTPVIPGHMGQAWYKFYVYVRPEALRPGWTRDRIMASIMEKGVPCFSGSCSEIYLEKAFVSKGFGPDTPYPIANELGRTSLMFLIHPTQTPESVERACTIARQVVQEASR